MYRNNILLTFSNFNSKSEIGIYKKKKSRELLPVEDINLINNKIKYIARNFLNFLVSNSIDNIYDYELNNGILNHMTIRTNDNENMIELYLFKMDENLINKIKEFDFINYQISSVYYQIQNCSKNNFRKI